ncbi:hypothetical protein PL11201_680035 [Planktothrix sp. PCC 11201]|nr:hypothetical protein PL11201_680035 [Planktothrix sp. PCC 11201]
MSRFGVSLFFDTFVNLSVFSQDVNPFWEKVFHAQQIIALYGVQLFVPGGSSPREQMMASKFNCFCPIQGSTV